MPRTVILSSARTPIGKLGGGLSTLPATHLGGIAIREALDRADVSPEQIQHDHDGPSRLRSANALSDFWCGHAVLFKAIDRRRQLLESHFYSALLFKAPRLRFHACIVSGTRLT